MNIYIYCIYFLNPQLIVGTYSKKRGKKATCTHSHTLSLLCLVPQWVKYFRTSFNSGSCPDYFPPTRKSKTMQNSISWVKNNKWSWLFKGICIIFHARVPIENLQFSNASEYGVCVCVFLDATTSFLLLKTTGNKGNGNSNNNTSKYKGPKLCLPICHSCNVVHGLCMYVIIVIPFWCCCMY